MALLAPEQIQHHAPLTAQAHAQVAAAAVHVLD
jgi:hypothetical protein